MGWDSLSMAEGESLAPVPATAWRWKRLEGADFSVNPGGRELSGLCALVNILGKTGLATPRAPRWYWAWLGERMRGCFAI